MAKNKKVIIDTDILIEIVRKNIEVIQKCDDIGPDNLVISSITYSEFLLGSRNKEEMIANMKFLKKFTIIRLNETIDKLFNSLYEKYCVSHRPGIPDMLIAATAQSKNLTIYTHNTRHFQFIPTLKLI